MRNIAVDTDGRLLMVNLTTADISDSAGAQEILKALRQRWEWLIPAPRDPDSRGGFPIERRRDSPWRTGEVLHGGCDWAEHRLHGG